MPTQFTNPPHSSLADSELGTAAHPKSGGYQHVAGDNGDNTAHMVGGLSLAGKWNPYRLDYTLTDDNEQGKLGFPNLARRGNGLVSIPNADEQIADNNITAIHSPAGRISGKVVNHISRVMTSGFPRGASSFARARERHDPAFLF